MNGECIMAVRAASSSVRDYCGNRSDVSDILAAFAAALALSTPTTTIEIARDTSLSFDDRIEFLISRQELVFDINNCTSWSRENTLRLVAILIIYFATAKKP